MKKERMLRKGFILIIIGILLSGCEPSPEEQVLISAGQTAVAITPIVENQHMPFHMETSFLESTDIDRIYNLYISLPVDYQEGLKEYPVIYVLDGDLFFGTVKDVVLVLSDYEMKDSIVVGLGYDTDVFGDIVTNHYQDMDPGGPNYPKFTDFFINELIPFIESTYRVDSSDRTLIGFSMAGLSALTMMFEYPDSFNKIVTISPSLYRNQRNIFIAEEDYAAVSKELPLRLYLSVGELEQDLVYNMVANLLELSSVLETRDYSGFSLTTEIIEGEDHYSVIPFSISKGLRAVNELDNE